MSKKREIIFDTETTGISPDFGHRVIEIGCVEMIDHVRTENTFHTYINPQREVEKEAFKVHGLSNDFLSDKPVFKDIVDDFLEFVGNDFIVAHNAKFDIQFINHHLAELNLKKISYSRVIDTLPMARSKFPGQRNSLDALCNRYKIDNSNRELHGALLDAELLSDVYAELLGVGSTQKNIVFSDTPKAKKKAWQSPSALKAKNIKPSRIFNLSESEQKSHEDFCKKNDLKTF